MMNHLGFSVGCAAWLATLMMAASPAAAAENDAPDPVAVVLGPEASAVERIAARDLTATLQKLFPGERFEVAAEPARSGRCILLGTRKSHPRLDQLLPPRELTAAESFVVTVVRDGERESAIIAGADPRGSAYGVYALLEKLGCGFYLSYDALPPPRTEAFSFQGWELADAPLVRERIVFEWHNFLSGCSTWNLPQWEAWIRQSQKMGYNAVMVHAYGNNPMVSYSFRGKAKPVGYLSTTVKGRDWSTMHVGNVRRLRGGEVFDQPVFGADAALVPDDQRTDAARRLMYGALAAAQQRAMDVYFAVNVNTTAANPQELIETLPPEARFRAGPTGQTLWLANPDTPEGYLFYKAQVQSLLDAYPQITCLVVWFRPGGTPWMELSVDQMPAAWQKQYAAELVRTPETAKLWRAPQMFALGKLAGAFDRALRELGRTHVRLAAGTWYFDHLAPADRFFPPGVKLIGLDDNVLVGRPQLGDTAGRKALRAVERSPRGHPRHLGATRRRPIPVLLSAACRVSRQARRRRSERLRHHPLDHPALGSVLRQPCQAGVAEHPRPAAPRHVRRDGHEIFRSSGGPCDGRVPRTMDYRRAAIRARNPRSVYGPES